MSTPWRPAGSSTPAVGEEVREGWAGPFREAFWSGEGPGALGFGSPAAAVAAVVEPRGWRVLGQRSLRVDTMVLAREERTGRYALVPVHVGLWVDGSRLPRPVFDAVLATEPERLLPAEAIRARKNRAKKNRAPAVVAGGPGGPLQTRWQHRTVRPNEVQVRFTWDQARGGDRAIREHAQIGPLDPTPQRYANLAGLSGRGLSKGLSLVRTGTFEEIVDTLTGDLRGRVADLSAAGRLAGLLAGLLDLAEEGADPEVGFLLALAQPDAMRAVNAVCQNPTYRNPQIEAAAVGSRTWVIDESWERLPVAVPGVAGFPDEPDPWPTVAAGEMRMPPPVRLYVPGGRWCPDGTPGAAPGAGVLR